MATLPGMPNMRVRMVLGDGELFGWLCSAPGGRSGGVVGGGGTEPPGGIGAEPPRQWVPETPPGAFEVADGEFARGVGSVVSVGFDHPTASFGAGVLGLVLLAPNPGRLP